MSILVTGAAGYVGSVTTELLQSQGEPVVVLDDLIRGHRQALDPGVPLYVGRVGDRDLVKRICQEHKISACIHFAARAYVGESVHAPRMYFEDNVSESVSLLGALLDAGVRHLVFSSTCATYGEPRALPIAEDHPQSPTNPYGWSKLMVEKVLQAYDAAYGLRYVALRYFNAAGATAQRGEHHDPETHLIPLALEVAAGVQPHLSVFGDDYPTADGTAVRDYIHVSDLAQAHVGALAHLRNGKPSASVNLGTGTGSSVNDVISVVQSVTARRLAVQYLPRRPGDPAKLVANATLAHDVLGWRPLLNLHDMIRSAWQWRQQHPTGYGSDSTSDQRNTPE